MGFSKLRIVAPRRNWRKRALVLARHAEDVLAKSEVFSTLSEAVADLNWTYGTTQRISERRGKFVAFDAFVSSATKKNLSLKVGIVFGRESKGLNNEELDCCDQLVSIPADEAYPSLNLSQAVMVSLFSIARKRLDVDSRVGRFEEPARPFLNKAGVQSALQSFAEALKCVGFYDGKDGRLDKIIKITDALFKRAGMFDYESQMLKGVSARIIQRATLNK